jgi:hypothetical protein
MLKYLLKYLFFILFFAVLIVGYFTLSIPTETSYAETLLRVRRGVFMVIIGGVGSLFCLHRITR